TFFRQGRLGPGVRWSGVAKVAARKLDLLDYAVQLSDLASPPGNRLEPLKGNLLGFHSIRINDQWRVVFRWTASGPMDVHIRDYPWVVKMSARLPRRKPTSPGEILREEFLVPLGLRNSSRRI